LNRQDILQMGRQAGSFIELAQEKDLLWLERFAALVAKHTLANTDPSSFMTWQEGYEVGKQTEREACAKVCEQTNDGTPYNLAEACAEAIRARGQA
jgi:hypothetical protein